MYLRYFTRLKPASRKAVLFCILYTCFVYILYTNKEASFGIERLSFPRIYKAIDQNETAILFQSRKSNRRSSASEYSSEFEIQSDLKQQDWASATINYTSFWNSLDAMIGNRELYPANFDVNEATNALRYAKLVAVDLFTVRTSLKWIITLEGGQHVLFKPAIVNNTEKQLLCNLGCEHPEYEIAGFTMNRLLGYRNFPFTTGRVLNWMREVLPVATQRVKDSMNVTEDAALCIQVECFRLRQPIFRCFKDGMIPGAMIYYLRRKVVFRSEANRSFHHYYPDVEYIQTPKPYMLKLPGDDSYCKIFRQMNPFKSPRDFGDILDVTVISYITNHRDQKITFLKSGSSFMHIMFDYGFAIRRKSFERLIELKDTLPSEFEEMTKDDPLYPLLQPAQLELMINRIKMLLALTDYCINLKGFENVVDDFI